MPARKRDGVSGGAGGGRTMIRSTLTTIGAAVSAALGGGTAHTPPRPSYLVTRQVPPYIHSAPGRLYHYRTPHAQTPLEFRTKYRNDLFGYGITETALTRALEEHFAAHGPIREKYVVLQTGDWTGHFTIDENTDERTLILRLTDSADWRIHATLPQMR